MKKIKVNLKWFRHEALHITWVSIEILSMQIQQHEYYKSGVNPKFNDAIDRAIEALSEAYVAVGAGKDNEMRRKIKISTESL